MQFRVLSIVTAAIVAVMYTPGSSSAQFGPAPVAVAPIVLREVAVGQSFVGTVMPLKKAVIGSAVDGRVVDFLVNEGDRVTKGQALARLLTETIRLELAGAEAERELRKQELAELENGSRPQEIQQALANMLAAKADWQFTKARSDRAKALYDNRAGKAISEELLEQAVAAAQKDEQSYEEAKAAHDLVVAGPRKEQIAQAKARLLVQDAVVEKLQDQIKKHTIISRFDGYVTAEYTEEGAWVSRGDPVAEVLALDQVDVLAAVLEDHVPHVQVGSEVHVEVPSLADRVFTGRVALVNPQADLQSRTFPVKVRVENEITAGGPLLKSGMLARIMLPIGKPQEALMVQKDALVLGGRGGPVVFVFEPDTDNSKNGKVLAVVVQLGVAEGTWIQVRGPLEAGQRVVVQGNERLRGEQEVVVTQSFDPPPEKPHAATTRKKQLELGKWEGEARVSDPPRRAEP
ncbi:MAG TPA: efflux RND transporter periplasmic adaptor subunit [Pirellulales bacterium]|nr:efflux RND transporter periplasmic adaptor subunit [Pirellulales bacterium]